MAEGIALRLTHVGTAQVFLSDVHDGVDALNGRHVRRKPGPLYLNPGDVVDLVYTSFVAASFETGVIRTFIDQGILTHSFVTGPTYPAGGTPLPPLAGVGDLGYGPRPQGRPTPAARGTQLPGGSPLRRALPAGPPGASLLVPGLRAGQERRASGPGRDVPKGPRACDRKPRRHL